MARFSFSRIERRIMPYGEWITRQISSIPARNTDSTKKYMYSGSSRSMKPNRCPRGTF